VKVAAALGLAAFFLTGLVVGVRLLALFARTRRAPELLAAMALLGLGPVASTCGAVAAQAAPSAPEIGGVLSAIAYAAAAVGSGSAALFTALVFHRESRAARRLTIALLVALAGTWAAMGATGGFDLTRPPGLFRSASQVLRLAILLWGAIEAYVYGRLLYRRVAVGLADPLVANRFELWGAALAAAALAMTVAFLGNVASLAASPWFAHLEAVIAAAGIAASIALLLAFLPPARYRRFVLARAARPDDARDILRAGNAGARR
jgi:hypothetical protein